MSVLTGASPPVILYHKGIGVGTPPNVHLSLLSSPLTIHVLSLPTPARLLTAAGTVLIKNNKAVKIKD